MTVRVSLGFWVSPVLTDSWPCSLLHNYSGQTETDSNKVKCRDVCAAMDNYRVPRCWCWLEFTFLVRVFTARCYASAVLAMGLCLSVRPSVTSRSSTKTAKQRITQTTPHDSPGTLVFWYQRSPRNSTGVTPYEGAECRWGGSKSATFDQ